MVKSIAKSGVAAFARRLPWGARRALLTTLIEEFGKGDVFVELGRELHVESLTVQGANGVVQGPLWDMGDSGFGLLGRYGRAGAWSAGTVRLFHDFFRDCTRGTFVDIGANIGLTLIPIARNPAVHCYGFEPDPTNFANLVRNIAANCPRQENVTLKQIGLFDRVDLLHLALSVSNSGDHRLYSEVSAARGSREMIPVPVRRLDDVLDPAGLDGPIAVKVDTQGCEPQIFAGGSRILAAASLLSVEFWPFGMRRNQGDVEGELRCLKANFREGAIIPGDAEAVPRWRPIDEVIGQLLAYWQDPSIGKRYFDVTVRR